MFVRLLLWLAENHEQKTQEEDSDKQPISIVENHTKEWHGQLSRVDKAGHLSLSALIVADGVILVQRKGAILFASAGLIVLYLNMQMKMSKRVTGVND